MRFGVAMLVTDVSMAPADFGRAVEERGFESLFVPEHTHVPVHAAHRGDASLGAAETRQGLDPFVALTAVAAATTRLRVGTGVCLAAQRDPIVLAKEVASLDVVSGGRFLFGVGAGWHEEEMLNHGVDPRTRVARLHEHLEAMRAIWRDYEASHHGRHVKFDPIWSLPKPVQRPHPPILLGGSGPRVLRRALALGAGWMPWHEVEG
ncbi:TIGR03619 family F420-dependent LLM class oxidoreductase, partial [Streptomyces sp. W16]|uniref:TIGR03619 family F420-dependent LLM class oxidoreductase n=1 Tax=Streptomyces sp. W16 TaxID=3076631 RepID=UPI00295BE073